MVGSSWWVMTDLRVNGISWFQRRQHRHHIVLQVCLKYIPVRRSVCVLSHLLRDGAITILLQAVQLVSLPQQRVEGLGCAVDCGGVGGDRKGSHQAHLLQRGVTASCAVQKLAVLQILSQSLQHRQRLVEVYLQSHAERKRFM